MILFFEIIYLKLPGLSSDPSVKARVAGAEPGKKIFTMSATITAADINKLRQATGAGMLDCRKALTESNGDFEAAIDWLRKQGQKVAAKRSDREAKEGVILAKTTADNKTGMIVCVSCETDFVSKNAEFVAFTQSITDA